MPKNPVKAIIGILMNPNIVRYPTKQEGPEAEHKVTVD